MHSRSLLTILALARFQLPVYHEIRKLRLRGCSAWWRPQASARHEVVHLAFRLKASQLGSPPWFRVLASRQLDSQVFWLSSLPCLHHRGQVSLSEMGPMPVRCPNHPPGARLYAMWAMSDCPLWRAGCARAWSADLESEYTVAIGGIKSAANITLAYPTASLMAAISAT
jgi:hypothetical protein